MGTARYLVATQLLFILFYPKLLLNNSLCPVHREHPKPPRLAGNSGGVTGEGRGCQAGCDKRRGTLEADPSASR